MEEVVQEAPPHQEREAVQQNPNPVRNARELPPPDFGFTPAPEITPHVSEAADSAPDSEPRCAGAALACTITPPEPTVHSEVTSSRYGVEECRPKIVNIMAGVRYPVGKVLEQMGCEVWNVDIAIDPSHDLHDP